VPVPTAADFASLPRAPELQLAPRGHYPSLTYTLIGDMLLDENALE